MCEPSDEQQKVINALSNNNNVIVDSCAGSGKTTTISFCAKHLSNLRFLLLTFNVSLKEDVIQSFKQKELSNVDVFTYHGLAVKYYSTICNNDIGIRMVLRTSMQPRNIADFQVIILDEVQDMCRLYFRFIWKFLLDIGKPVLFLFLGDEHQCIYEFKGADNRFLTLAHQCWKDFPLLVSNEFVQCTLHTSYRITNSMSDFINKAMLGNERIKACKDGPAVVYYKRNMYSVPIFIQTKIQQFILKEKANYSDFLILMPSPSHPTAKFTENKLVEMGMPCYYPSQENESISSDIMQNKIGFSTFHSSKGTQRKYVFLLGFDITYNLFYSGKSKDPLYCPNELYVAASRAQHYLCIVHEENKNMLPFLKISQTNMVQSKYIHFQGIPSGPNPNAERKVEVENKRKKDVSAFTRFISEDTIEIISPILEEIFVTITPVVDEDILQIPSFHETRTKTVEDVSDINGTILPIMFIDQLREEQGLQKMPVLQHLIQQNLCAMDEKMTSKSSTFLQDMANAMPLECETISHYLYVGCLLSATTNKTFSRMKQIPCDNFDWLDEDTVQLCMQRLKDVIGSECSSQWHPEYTIIRGDSDDDHLLIDKLLSPYSDTIYRFSGRVDLFTEKSIWELKCTSQLTIEHKLQLVLYAWLYQNKGYGLYDGKKEKEYHLFNYKTNEHLELKATREQLNMIIFEMIKGKQCTDKLNDSDFLSNLHKHF